MINVEKWKNEILECVNGNSEVALCKGKPTPCNGTNCYDCDIYNVKGECSANIIKWMFKEYAEPPEYTTLTPEEIRFCEVLPDYWVARDSDNTLWLLADKPYRASDRWDLIGSTPIEINTEKVKADFKFISWQTDAYNTSEMLTWEVNK